MQQNGSEKKMSSSKVQAMRAGPGVHIYQSDLYESLLASDTDSAPGKSAAHRSIGGASMRSGEAKPASSQHPSIRQRMRAMERKKIADVAEQLNRRHEQHKQLSVKMENENMRKVQPPAPESTLSQ